MLEPLGVLSTSVSRAATGRRPMLPLLSRPTPEQPGRAAGAPAPLLGPGAPPAAPSLTASRRLPVVHRLLSPAWRPRPPTQPPAAPPSPSLRSLQKGQGCTRVPVQRCLVDMSTGAAGARNKSVATCRPPVFELPTSTAVPPQTHSPGVNSGWHEHSSTLPLPKSVASTAIAPHMPGGPGLWSGAPPGCFAPRGLMLWLLDARSVGRPWSSSNSVLE